jgi:hypothetical protein
MLSFDEAKQIALEKIGPQCILIESATLEKPYGWYFRAESRAFFETADPKQKAIGSGGFIVDKADGRVFEFGSGFPLEKWIANYEKGFKYHRYDLTISAVSDLVTAIELLHQLGMQYVVPEAANGTVWVIPQLYTPDEIRKMLAHLPCTFADQGFWNRVDVFDDIAASGSCEYELRESLKSSTELGGAVERGSAREDGPPHRDG